MTLEKAGEAATLSVFCCPSRYTQGPDATARLGAEISSLGLTGPLLVVAARSALRRLADSWKASFGESGMEHTVLLFGGECSLAEIERVKVAAREAKARVVVGAGGGKVLDTARAFKAVSQRAIKKVPYVDPATGQRTEPAEPNAIKLESFVFDALHEAGARLYGATIDFTNEAKTGGLDMAAQSFLRITYPPVDLIKTIKAAAACSSSAVGPALATADLLAPDSS